MTSTPDIPGYELIDTLGTGSFATVWSAYDLRLDREVAVKVLTQPWCRNPDVRRSFMNEARVLVTSESHRLARGFVVDETADGRPYLVMALADRGTLGERMTRRGVAGQVFSPIESFSIIGELARAIGDVHALGHLHRDIKPNNVLIMEIPKGSNGRAVPGLAFDERMVLSDFGLVAGLDVGRSTSVGGSPGYVAPEQARGDDDNDERTDLFALGVIALELMTGRSADRPTSLEEAGERRHHPRVRLEATGVVVSDVAVELLEELVQPVAADRPASAAEVVHRCESIVRELDQIDVPDQGGSSIDALVERRGLWGQELSLGDVPSTPSVVERADETLIRPRNVRDPQTPPPAAIEPDPKPRRPRDRIAVDVAIGVAALALVAVAVVLWIT